jgi:hypothetical protein
VTAVAGEAAPSQLNTGLYDVTYDGQALIVPSVGGINPNVRVGDGAFAFMADHIEPGVSVRHPDDRINATLNVLACIGNEAVVISGDAKGEKGRVTGKHGGVEHVMIDFAPDAMRKMAIGDKIQVWGCGLGMRLLDAQRSFGATTTFKPLTIPWRKNTGCAICVWATSWQLSTPTIRMDAFIARVPFRLVSWRTDVRL